MIHSENSGMNFWRETYMGQGSSNGDKLNEKEVADTSTHSEIQ
jgi:hypothetical protein